MNQTTLRKVHRWLGLIAGLQLLAWTVSGFYFTVIPIDEIRGNHLTPFEDISPVIKDLNLLSPSEVVVGNPDAADTMLSDLTLTSPNGRPIYVFGTTRFDAVTGELLGHLSAEEATEIVERRTDLKPIDTQWVSSVLIDSEYRGGELPAWRLLLDGDAAVYVGATSGRVRAVRTDAWRVFDFLWMLHIMDYEERDDFNHWLIQLLALLSLVTILSGLVLFFLTQRWRNVGPTS